MLHPSARHSWVQVFGDSVVKAQTVHGSLALVVGEDTIYPEVFRLAIHSEAGAALKAQHVFMVARNTVQVPAVSRRSPFPNEGCDVILYAEQLVHQHLQSLILEVVDADEDRPIFAQKLSQNRDDVNHAQIAEQLEKRGDAQSVAIAEEMKTRK